MPHSGSKRRPVITVVDARPMEDGNFSCPVSGQVGASNEAANLNKAQLERSAETKSKDVRLPPGEAPPPYAEDEQLMARDNRDGISRRRTAPSRPQRPVSMMANIPPPRPSSGPSASLLTTKRDTNGQDVKKSGPPPRPGPPSRPGPPQRPGPPPRPTQPLRPQSMSISIDTSQLEQPEHPPETSRPKKIIGVPMFGMVVPSTETNSHGDVDTNTAQVIPPKPKPRPRPRTNPPVAARRAVSMGDVSKIATSSVDVEFKNGEDGSEKIDGLSDAKVPTSVSQDDLATSNTNEELKQVERASSLMQLSVNEKDIVDKPRSVSPRQGPTIIKSLKTQRMTVVDTKASAGSDEKPKTGPMKPVYPYGDAHLLLDPSNETDDKVERKMPPTIIRPQRYSADDLNVDNKDDLSDIKKELVTVSSGEIKEPVAKIEPEIRKKPTIIRSRPQSMIVTKTTSMDSERSDLDERQESTTPSLFHNESSKIPVGSISSENAPAAEHKLGDDNIEDISSTSKNKVINSVSIETSSKDNSNTNLVSEVSPTTATILNENIPSQAENDSEVINQSQSVKKGPPPPVKPKTLPSPHSNKPVVFPKPGVSAKPKLSPRAKQMFRRSWTPTEQLPPHDPTLVTSAYQDLASSNSLFNQATEEYWKSHNVPQSQRQAEHRSEKPVPVKRTLPKTITKSPQSPNDERIIASSLFATKMKSPPKAPVKSNTFKEPESLKSPIYPPEISRDVEQSATKEESKSIVASVPNEDQPSSKLSPDSESATAPPSAARRTNSSSFYSVLKGHMSQSETESEASSVDLQHIQLQSAEHEDNLVNEKLEETSKPDSVPSFYKVIKQHVANSPTGSPTSSKESSPIKDSADVSSTESRGMEAKTKLFSGSDSSRVGGNFTLLEDEIEKQSLFKGNDSFEVLAEMETPPSKPRKTPPPPPAKSYLKRGSTSRNTSECSNVSEHPDSTEILVDLSLPDDKNDSGMTRLNSSMKPENAPPLPKSSPVGQPTAWASTPNLHLSLEKTSTLGQSPLDPVDEDDLNGSKSGSLKRNNSLGAQPARKSLTSTSSAGSDEVFEKRRASSGGLSDHSSKPARPPPAKVRPPRPSQPPSIKNEVLSSKPPVVQRNAPARRSRPNKPEDANLGPAPSLPPRPELGHPLFHYVAKGPRAVVMFDFNASQEDELSLKAGEIVLLNSFSNEEWLRGTSVNGTGLFPVNFVDIIEKPTEDMKRNPIKQSVQVTEEPITDSITTGPRCLARFDFDGEVDSDLSFKTGDMIILEKRVGDDWLYGRVGNNSGNFPVDFVEILEDLPIYPIASQSDHTVTALYDFHGEEGELSFKCGDKITVTGRVNNEWLYGKTDRQIGSFPATFIDHTPNNLPKHEINATQPESGDKELRVDFGGQDNNLEGQNDTTDLNDKPDKESLFPPNKDPIIPPTEESLIPTTEESLIPNTEESLISPTLDPIIPPSEESMIALSEESFIPPTEESLIPPTEDSYTHSEGNDKNISTDKNTSPENTVKMSHAPLAIALHNFEKQQEGDLSFEAGDSINLVAIHGEEWLKGELNGEIGIFPANFVEIIYPLPETVI